MAGVFTRAFWKAATERALKTAAQAAVLYAGIGEGFNLVELDVVLTLGYAGGGALLSILTSLLSAPIGNDGSPSLVG